MVLPIHKKNSLIEHKHTVIYSLTNITPGTPMLVLLIIAALNYLLVNLKYYFKIKFLIVSGMKRINESLKDMIVAKLNKFSSLWESGANDINEFKIFGRI